MSSHVTDAFGVRVGSAVIFYRGDVAPSVPREGGVMLPAEVRFVKLIFIVTKYFYMYALMPPVFARLGSGIHW